MLTRGAEDELDMSRGEPASLVLGHWQGNRAGQINLTANLSRQLFFPPPPVPARRRSIGLRSLRPTIGFFPRDLVGLWQYFLGTKSRSVRNLNGLCALAPPAALL